MINKNAINPSVSAIPIQPHAPRNTAIFAATCVIQHINAHISNNAIIDNTIIIL